MVDVPGIGIGKTTCDPLAAELQVAPELFYNTDQFAGTPLFLIPFSLEYVISSPLSNPYL